MLLQHESEDGGEPASEDKLKSLKEFRSAGRGYWSHIPEQDWNDWRWQLKHRITTAATIPRSIRLHLLDELFL